MVRTPETRKSAGEAGYFDADANLRRLLENTVPDLLRRKEE